MKRKSNFLVLTIALVCAVLVSCHVNDDIRETDNGAVRFTAGIGDAAALQGTPATRATGTDWAADDAIGIFMVEHGTTTIAENAANRQYTTTTGGTFAAVAGNEIYYPMDGSAVDFIAYHPWAGGNTLGTPIDVEIATTQTVVSQPKIDLLYATANNSGSGYNKVTNETTPVALTFDHMLTRLVMNTKADASVGFALSGMAVTIKGMYTQNTFDLVAGTLGDTPGATANIIPLTITDGKQYDAIIMPGAYMGDVVTVEFTIDPATADAETFTWEVPAKTFAGGSEYTYEITLTRRGVQFTGTINKWNPVKGDPGIAD